ncbi:DNA mismatch repair protein MutT [Sporosarcina luteola]|uniref:DNA mismatch repair protein MutT n=1 Tax=Sporosarcina luteola TaxID=582850 RepID=A0A511Z562_9BACL|nr:NUDIX hydrolase [Sporosarcina luteola]GEN82583.1 DNA mismatch repair protein MutT [Sporosarcina luteola]
MNYIKDMRELIGHETLFTVGCGVIIENGGCILLQHRTDEDNWCIPGGVMEIGETFEQTAKRETYEETGLDVNDLKLFGMYSGESCFVQYQNYDKVYSVQIIFMTTSYGGELKQQGIESKEHRFFKKEDLPENLNPRQEQFIRHWAENKALPVIS